MQSYKRILLKLSGESLAGNRKQGIETEALLGFAQQIKQVAELGVEVAVVIGGGNIFRGLQEEKKGFDRVKGDQMGMLATTINSLALQSALESLNKPTSLYTAVRMEPIGEFYSKQKAVAALKKGNIVIVAGGTGNPYFTTDTASALRAIELETDAFFKATRVDGIYTADPEKDKNAKKYDSLTYTEAIQKNLKVMDITAFSLCKENKMPIIVFDINNEKNLLGIIRGEKIGSRVSE